MSSARVIGVVATHALGGILVAFVVVAIVVSLVAGEDPSNALPFLVLLAVTAAAGWLLAWRRPGNTVGWLLLAAVVVFVSAFPVGALAQAIGSSAPTLTAWLYWYAGDSDVSWTWIPPVWTLLIWIPLHFPDGRLPSRRWRVFGWAAIAEGLLAIAVFTSAMGTIAGYANPLVIPAIRDNLSWLFVVVSTGAIAVFVGTVVSLVVRYRRGTGVMRAQLRWMLWGVAIAVAFLVATWFLPADIANTLDSWAVLGYALIPAAIGVAVLRYRLYEIDRIISRTAAYAIVTLVVLGTYGGIVLLAGLLLPGLESVGIALATLAAAAVFLPLLRIVRRAVDRVFNRAQYDAEKVVGTFGERIRTGVDPHTAGPELVSAVESSLQPAAVGIWIRGAAP